jgi:anti-sigma factor RsiW
MSGCEMWRDSVSADALGGLDDSEREALHEHLAVCPACAESHERFLRVVRLLDEAGLPEELVLPEGLEERLLARAESSESLPSRRRVRSWRGFGTRRVVPALAAALAGGLLTLVVLLGLGVHRGSAAKSDSASKAVTAAAVRLAATSQAPGASALVYLVRRAGATTIVLQARGLPPPRPGEHCVVWLSSDHGSFAVGTIQVSRSGWATAVLPSPRRVVSGSLIEISLVPKGNGTSYRPLVRGTLN